MLLNKLAASGILALAVTIPTASHASPILITGDVEACFGLGCTPDDTASLGSLITYVSSPLIDFSGTTDPDDGGLAVNFGTGDFGTIFVGSASPSSLINTPFTLLLTFLSPTVSDAQFSAQITGKVSTTQSNGILVKFEPSQIILPYIMDNGSGILSVSVFDTAVPSTGMGKISGYIQATAVPEASTSLLLATGLLGLLSLKRNRTLSI
jgi:hypothetical protein